MLEKSKAMGHSVEGGVLPGSDGVTVRGVTYFPPWYAGLPDAGPSVLGVLLGGRMDAVVGEEFDSCRGGSQDRG
jgi:hypothetical protein